MKTHLPLQTARHLLALLALASHALAADITLTTGRTLVEARIVAIGNESVTIVHKAGSEAVPVADVDLETLARAHIALAEKQEERKRRAAEVVAAQPERAAATEAEGKKPPQNLARAFDNAAAGKGSLAKLSPTTAEAKLLAIKQHFPAQTKGVFRSRKTGQSYEYEVPAHEVFSHYRGMVRIATLESAPKVAAQLDARLAQDLTEYRRRASQAIPDSSEQAKHRATVQWLEKLRGYLSELRAAAR